MEKEQTALQKASMTAIERGDLRASIQARKALSTIEAIASNLERGAEPATLGDGSPVEGSLYFNPLQQRYERLIDKERTAQLKVAMDARFRLLNKVLPDLKAVEHTGANGTDLNGQPMSNIDTLNRLRVYMAMSSALVTARVVEGELVDTQNTLGHD